MKKYSLYIYITLIVLFIFTTVCFIPIRASKLIPILEENILEDYGSFTKEMLEHYPFLESMLNIYNQRASMGSTDALSIIYRDIIICIFIMCLIKFIIK